MTFNKLRRQKFLGEKYYAEGEEWLKESIRRARHILETDDELTLEARSRFRWRIAGDGLELLILYYTAGHSIEELSKQLPQVIADFDVYIAHKISPRSKNPPENEADTLEITQLDAYVYVFWLLALCKLLDHEQFIPTVMGWVDKTFKFNRGRDGLLERVVQALTGSHVPVGRVLLHPKPYIPLAKVTVSPPEERPAFVKEFLEIWYKNMKSCYWHGSHLDSKTYFGYWSFEAALVTVLWEIDDSSYRDHLVYPKDLVDFARARQKAAIEAALPKPHISRQTGEACPYSGRWGVRESPNTFLQERMFRAGDIFPPAIRRDNSEGPVTWIVLMREDGGPTRME